MKQYLIFLVILWLAFFSITPKVSSEFSADKPIAIEFKLVVDNSNEEQLILGDEILILLSQQNVKSAELSVVELSNTVTILFHLTEDGKKKLLDLTTKYTGRRLAIFIDGKFIIAPVIRETIRSGSLAITGNITEEEANQIVSRINQKN
ncbi:MAG: hypothetical protein KAS66_13710 [Candidatus Omnitrophica bacterium]|nr:hypothetical protein [Candidatus Omnitrophota bacterium]